MRVCVCVWLTVRERLQLGVLVYWAPQSRVPGGKNAAITPLAKEGGRQGCWAKAEGVRERNLGKEGREGGCNTADLANNSK